MNIPFYLFLTYCTFLSEPTLYNFEGLYKEKTKSTNDLVLVVYYASVVYLTKTDPVLASPYTRNGSPSESTTFVKPTFLLRSCSDWFN